MTESVALLEYDRIRPGDVCGRDGRVVTIPTADYEELYQFDTRLGAEPVFEWGRESAKAGEYVGVIQLSELAIELLPKIHRSAVVDERLGRTNLLQMLSIADGFDDLRPQEIAAQEVEDAPMAERMYEIFATRLHREFRRGVQRGYVALRENQAYLRGRIVFSEHLKQNVTRRDRFFVEHDEFLPDTPLNRIFKATCRTLLTFVESPIARDRLAGCLGMLDAVADVELEAHEFRRVHLDRRATRFADLVRFCEMVLLNRSPSASVGDKRAFSLLFNMWALYESYITSMIARFVLPPEWTLFVQASGRRRPLLYEEGSRRYQEHLELQPDLYLERRGGDAPGDRLVVDTKWKSLDVDGERVARSSRSDLFQLYAYAQRFGALRNLLLYPAADGENTLPVSRRVLRVPRGSDDVPSAQTIEAVVVTLPDDLRTGHDELVARLRAALLLDAEDMSGLLSAVP